MEARQARDNCRQRARMTPNSGAAGARTHARAHAHTHARAEPWHQVVLVLRGISITWYLIPSGTMVSSDTDTTWYLILLGIRY